jgi:multisubunit Na+/H+ antiporter MnhG subunit
MVDLVVLQTISYTVGAISVVLGVIYYAINLRESRRNGRITLAKSLTQRMETRVPQ